MIDTKELRIGNLLIEPVIGISSVNGVYERVIYIVKKQDSYQYAINIENLFPIPLTPEILDKIGIIEKSEVMEMTNSLYHYREINGFTLHWVHKNATSEDWFFELWFNDNHGNDCVIIKELRFLHTFQNIFQILTGTELDVSKIV